MELKSEDTIELSNSTVRYLINWCNGLMELAMAADLPLPLIKGTPFIEAAPLEGNSKVTVSKPWIDELRNLAKAYEKVSSYLGRDFEEEAAANLTELRESGAWLEVEAKLPSKTSHVAALQKPNSTTLIR